MYFGMEDWDMFFEEWQQHDYSWAKLMLGKRLREALHTRDTRCLPAAFSAGCSLPEVHLGDKDGEHDIDEHVCELLLENGFVCGETFSSKGKLIMHQCKSMKHPRRHPISSVLTCSQCPIRYTNLSSIEYAKNHVNAAYRQGHCIVGKHSNRGH
jgi:hypothetical protein